MREDPELDNRVIRLLRHPKCYNRAEVCDLGGSGVGCDYREEFILNKTYLWSYGSCQLVPDNDC